MMIYIVSTSADEDQTFFGGKVCKILKSNTAVNGWDYIRIK